MLAGPVRDVVQPRQLLGDLARDHRRLEQIIQLQAHAGHAVAHAQQRGGIIQMHHHQRAVELVHTDLEQAADGKTPEARQHPGGRDAGLRNHQVDLVAHFGAQRARQFAAQHDAVFAAHQVTQRALLHVLGQLGDLGLHLRQHAAQQGAGQIAAAPDHALALDVGRHRAHLRVLLGKCRRLWPVHQRPLETGNRGVRGHAQDAHPQLALEAVHHAEHRDQRHHAHRDAQHRGQRDEGNEMIAALGAGVAQADEQLQR